ncbi:MAG: hypothetical protein N2Z69_00855 [Methylophilaceae bacterium]|nr:hypothetical protein [Methylophilaceae bacterium]
MELVLYRNPEVRRESRSLPAATYNLARILLSRSPNGCVFIPIRTMQYLAILDHEEIVFVDGERKCWIDLAWCNLNPHVREGLAQPVPYQAVYYHPAAPSLMARLQPEFHLALLKLQQKGYVPSQATVLKFPAPAEEP